MQKIMLFITGIFGKFYALIFSGAVIVLFLFLKNNSALVSQGFDNLNLILLDTQNIAAKCSGKITEPTKFFECIKYLPRVTKQNRNLNIDQKLLEDSRLLEDPKLLKNQKSVENIKNNSSKNNLILDLDGQDRVKNPYD